MLKRILFLITVILAMGAFVNADETAQNAAPEALNIAVADDFAPVAQELGKEFAHLGGMPVKFTVGSSEELLQMIKKGEQFDVFMSANTDYPVDLEKSGLTEGSPEVYAIGSLALYAKGKELTHNGLDVLQPGGFTSLGVAEPKMSPYGVAAVETLKKLEIYEQVQNQIVYGDSAEDVLRMVEAGKVEAALVSYGDLGDEQKSKAWIVPGRMHTPIEQSLVALKGGNPAATQRWITFIESDTAKSILVSSGYGITNVEKVEE
jgi:molybdate transport system substrate-binding protein